MNPTHAPVQGKLRHCPAVSRRAQAFTLIEMLVALTITLIMMGAVVTLFGVITENVSGSRAVVEMTDRLRACRNRLQADLQSTTASMTPPLRPEMDEGYFLVLEGVNTDGASGFTNTLLGDTDDILAFTVHSRGEPYVGMIYAGTPTAAAIESPMAEVIYFLKQDGPVLDPTVATPERLFTLYRRVLLITPSRDLTAAVVNPFYDLFDISARIDPVSGKRVANTLGDLTKHENRFAHTPQGAAGVGGFPFRLMPTATNPPALSGNRLGEDVLMTNVLAFDLQVFDPGAPLVMSTTGNVALEPRDPGYSSGTPIPSPGVLGAYVDLGYTANGPAPNALFNFQASVKPHIKSMGAAVSRPYAYDTWSLHYENDGIDEDTANGADSGMNGLDDGGIGGMVDDLGEYDTLPPYSAPLRAIRVTIRTYEPSSKEVREITVIQDFLPE